MSGHQVDDPTGQVSAFCSYPYRKANLRDITCIECGIRLNLRNLTVKDSLSLSGIWRFVFALHEIDNLISDDLNVRHRRRQWPVPCHLCLLFIRLVLQSHRRKSYDREGQISRSLLAEII